MERTAIWHCACRKPDNSLYLQAAHALATEMAGRFLPVKGGGNPHLPPKAFAGTGACAGYYPDKLS
jgi:hypothetical protein